MPRAAFYGLCLSLALGVQLVAPPPALLADDDDDASETLELKVLTFEDEPDEGVPGGSVRLMPDEGGGAVSPAPATAAERAASDAERPTAEAAESAPSTSQTGDFPTAKEISTPLPPLSSQQEELRNKIRRTLAIYEPKHLNTRDNSPWEVMHGIIAYGVDTKLFRGSSRGEEVNAIAWMNFNGGCRGEQLFSLNRGSLVARQGPGLQGHFGQYLAIIAQCHVKSDYPLSVGGKSFTVEDLIEHEKLGCQAGEELTFKLIGLMHYLGSDAVWQNRDGQTWTIQRLIREELAQPVRGAACGGTHRLMGFSYAVNKRVQRGEPVTGEFRRAQRFIHDYHRYTFSLQNADGSFSTDWFKGPGAIPDIDRRLKTTGHIAEWLSFSLSNEELNSPRMLKSVDYLAGILAHDPRHAWEIGPLGHSLHALRIYDRRMFQPYDAPPAVAEKPGPRTASRANGDTTDRVIGDSTDSSADDEVIGPLLLR